MMKETLDTLAMKVMVQHEYYAKVENGIKKQLHVLKQQLRKNMKLHRETNGLQQE